MPYYPFTWNATTICVFTELGYFQVVDDDEPNTENSLIESVKIGSGNEAGYFGLERGDLKTEYYIVVANDEHVSTMWLICNTIILHFREY